MTVGELIRRLRALVASGRSDPEDDAVVVDLDGDKRPIIGVSSDVTEVWIEWDEWEDHE